MWSVELEGIISDLVTVGGVIIAVYNMLYGYKMIKSLLYDGSYYTHDKPEDYYPDKEYRERYGE